MVSITIDGKQLEVPEGTSVLQAAQSAGIHIPTLCDHPELKPYGGCRLCLVEVEGARTLQPSCTLPASNNMVVRTNTPAIHTAREFVLTLIFSERNHFCMYCQVSGGDCELQNAAYAEGMTHWPIQPNWEKYTVDASNPYFVMDNNRCILCRRCVRACAEIAGAFTLGIEERGANSYLVADYGVPLGESTCVSCGTCVQVCPTGAIIDRSSAYRGKEMQVESHKSVCAGCSVGCGIDVLTRDNHLVRIEGNWEAPVNGGLLCKEGRFLPLEEKRERIVTPLVRKDGALKAATWEEALAHVAARLAPLNGQAGSGVAALASTRLPAEALYQFQQLFANNLKSDMVTSLEEGAYTAAASELAKAVGRPFEARLDDLKTADCVLTIGADLADEHQVAGFFIRRAMPAGTHLIVADDKASGLDALANLTLKYIPGAAMGALRGISAAVAALSLQKVQPVETAPAAGDAGIATAAEYEKAARLLAGAQSPVIVFGKGLTREALEALVELARITGARVLGIKGEANSTAAALFNLDKAFTLDGHQAAYVALGDDTTEPALVERLSKVPFLAVQASYLSPLTEQADVVLPVATWAEQGGQYINLEGRVQTATAALEAPSGVKTNLEALKSLSTALGCAPAEDLPADLCEHPASVAVAAF